MELLNNSEDLFRIVLEKTIVFQYKPGDFIDPVPIIVHLLRIDSHIGWPVLFTRQPDGSNSGQPHSPFYTNCTAPIVLYGVRRLVAAFIAIDLSMATSERLH